MCGAVDHTQREAGAHRVISWRQDKALSSCFLYGPCRDHQSANVEHVSSNFARSALSIVRSPARSRICSARPIELCLPRSQHHIPRLRIIRRLVILPSDVTVDKPCTRVVYGNGDCEVTMRWQHRGVSTRWIDHLETLCLTIPVLGSLSEDEKVVAVKVDRMRNASV